jgi:hypothetical protein
VVTLAVIAPERRPVLLKRADELELATDLEPADARRSAGHECGMVERCDKPQRLPDISVDTVRPVEQAVLVQLAEEQVDPPK